MLRLLALALVLLNAGYFVWSQGLLRPYGVGPLQQSESFRLAQQIRPELVRILSADEARRAEEAGVGAPRTGGCLQAGLFDEVQTAALRQTAQAVLPPGSWLLDTAVEPARWIIYMGKYPDAQALARKRAELAALNLRTEPLTNAALDYGLSLGGYDTEERANAELAALGLRGVQTARVVLERPESRGAVFRIPLVDDALKARLELLKGSLVNKPLRACN